MQRKRCGRLVWLNKTTIIVRIKNQEEKFWIIQFETSRKFKTCERLFFQQQLALNYKIFAWPFRKNMIYSFCKCKLIPIDLFLPRIIFNKMGIDHFSKWLSDYVSSQPQSCSCKATEIYLNNIWPWGYSAYPSNKKLQFAVWIRDILKAFGRKLRTSKKVGSWLISIFLNSV